MAITLFAKVMPRFENCIHTNFGIIEESCGGRYDPLERLGQCIMLQGSSNREIHCFMFKALEEKGHESSTIHSITLEKMLKKASVLIDETYLWVNGKDCGEIMSMMLRDYSTLHETVGCKIQSSKLGFFAWKWFMKME